MGALHRLCHCDDTIGILAGSNLQGLTSIVSMGRFATSLVFAAPRRSLLQAAASIQDVWSVSPRSLQRTSSLTPALLFEFAEGFTLGAPPVDFQPLTTCTERFWCRDLRLSPKSSGYGARVDSTGGFSGLASTQTTSLCLYGLACFCSYSAGSGQCAGVSGSATWWFIWCSSAQYESYRHPGDHPDDRAAGRCLGRCLSGQRLDRSFNIYCPGWPGHLDRAWPPKNGIPDLEVAEQTSPKPA